MSRVRVRPAELVLGLVDPVDQADAERLLNKDPLFRSDVERLQATAIALEQLDRTAWRPEPPPPFEDRQAVAKRPARSRPRLRVAAAAVALAGLAVAVLLVLHAGGSSPAPRVVALHALDSVPGRATLVLRGNDAELRGRGMPPSGPHDYYEAWLGDARGRMVSMGTFRVGRNGTVDAHMPIAVDLSRYHVVDVSLEPDDGNPAHSDKSVMRATI